MTALIEFLSHLRTTVKAAIAIIAIIVTATVSGLTFFDSKIEASEKKIMELRREDMQRLETKLNKIESDTEFVKRFLIENRSK